MNAGTVEHASPVYTDEYRTYRTTNSLGYRHQSVNHSVREDVCRGTGATVDAIEGFWAQLDRVINGTHTNVSGKHFSKYPGKFEYRWNMRRTNNLMLDRLLSSFVR